MAKELTYESCFPGRFLTAGHFLGKKVTLTVADAYLEDLEGKPKPGSKPKPPKLILSFVGKKLELVIPKTNAYCIKMMFGNMLADWVGKRITFFPTTCRFGPGMVDCIRVWGSPDIDEDKILTVPQGRNSPIEMTMHAMPKTPQANGTSQAQESSQPAKTPPAAAQNAEPPSILVSNLAVHDAWSALGWSTEEGYRDASEYKGEDYLGYLSGLIDKMNSVEAF